MVEGFERRLGPQAGAAAVCDDLHAGTLEREEGMRRRGPCEKDCGERGEARRENSEKR
jgi:hypothetical protein